MKELKSDSEIHKAQHGEELFKIRQQLSDKVNSLKMDNGTNMEN